MSTTSRAVCPNRISIDRTVRKSETKDGFNLIVDEKWAAYFPKESESQVDLLLELFARAAPASNASEVGACQRMTEDQIKHMVNRFLGWRVPSNFNPDGGIVYTAARQLPGIDRRPSGTNIFDAEQAEAMIRYIVDGMPACAAPASNAKEARPDTSTYTTWQPIETAPKDEMFHAYPVAAHKR